MDPVCLQEVSECGGTVAAGAAFEHLADDRRYFRVWLEASVLALAVANRRTGMDRYALLNGVRLRSLEACARPFTNVLREGEHNPGLKLAFGRGPVGWRVGCVDDPAGFVQLSD
jgi:hypothetical protein